MIVSLNEIGSSAAKAVIGCQYSLGIAEEMAFATRWLCAHGLPGVEQLAWALAQPEPIAPTVERHQGVLRIHHSDRSTIAALTTAPSIPELLVAGRPAYHAIHLPALTHPLLLLPFAARTGGQEQHDPVQLRWQTPDQGVVVADCNPAGTQLYSDQPHSLTQTQADQVVLAWGTTDPDTPLLHPRADLLATRDHTIANGCEIAEQSWQQLQALAHKTYVPISEASRLRGAGASLTDND